MRINRHNYEEFFLLYVDNELSATDRNAVELFVRENPDLQIELQLLKQTVAEADSISMHKKDWLYMEDDVSALQESLLLYTDDELNPADKKLVETMLSADKAAEAEWKILQQTIAEADTSIVFEDKPLLYRHAVARIIGIKWWRIAAAAALLSFIVWTAISVYKNNFSAAGDDGGLVKKVKTESVQSPDNELMEKSNPDNKQPETTTPKNNIANNAVENNETEQKTNLVKQSGETLVSRKNNTQHPVKATEESITAQKIENKKPGNDLPKPHFENISNNKSNETVVKNVLPENNNNKISGKNTDVVKTNPNEKAFNETVTNSNNNNMAPAVTAITVANNKTADEGNNRYLNLDNEKEKRTGLGGFLRKAKRMIERTTNINTGQGVKIAGFEIALK